MLIAQGARIREEFFFFYCVSYNHDSSAAPFHSNTPFGSSTNTLSLQAHGTLQNTHLCSKHNAHRSSTCAGQEEWNSQTSDTPPFIPPPPPFLSFPFLHRRDTYIGTKNILIFFFTLNFQNGGGESTRGHDFCRAPSLPVVQLVTLNLLTLGREFESRVVTRTEIFQQAENKIRLHGRRGKGAAKSFS